MRHFFRFDVTPHVICNIIIYLLINRVLQFLTIVKSINYLLMLFLYFVHSLVLHLIFRKLGRTFRPFIAAAKLFGTFAIFSWLQRFEVNRFSSWSNFSSLSLVTFFPFWLRKFLMPFISFVFLLDLYYVLTRFNFSLALSEKSLFLFV